MTLTATVTLAVAPPPNDDCPNATVVGALPFTDLIDTTLAKPEALGVDFLSCGPGGGPTVWYRFTPTASGTYCARTCGSDYDTVLGLGRDGCAGFGSDCSDDVCFFQSAIGFDAIAGAPVWLVAGAYDFFPRPAQGGHLVVTIADAFADTDGDGVFDCDDDCSSLINTPQADTDDDGVGDVCDPCNGIGEDVDADGICGYTDRCRDVADPAQLDADSDFVGDVCDMCPTVGGIDADLDGVCDDVADNCLGVANPGQTDGDGDGVGDACDACSGSGAVDGDGDGVCDDTTDNCLGVANPDQTDSDADGVGDACDFCPGLPGSSATDGDGDGRPDACDACPDDPSDTCATLWACLTPDDHTLLSTLVRLDPATARATLVGSLGTGGCGGLGFQPGTGRLFALAKSLVAVDTYDLFRVDPTTAAVTRVGPTTGLDGQFTAGLAVRADGALFAVVSGLTTRIDPATGAPIPLSAPTSIGYSGGLVFDGTGTLFFVDGGVWSIDQATGEATSSGYLDTSPLFFDYDRVWSVAFDGTTHYAGWTAYVYSGPIPTFGVSGVQAGGNPLTSVGLAPRDLRALTAQQCGNGTIEGGEQCDDGNTVAGDCCSATCLAEAPGSPCASDASSCTADTCNGLGACTHLVPVAAGCAPAPSTRASMSIATGTKAKLAWSWRGTVVDPTTFGTPDTTTAMTLCLSGPDGTLLADASAPAGGTCQDGDPCWRAKTAGYDYVDHDRTPDGIDKIVLRAKPAPGNARIKVKAKQPNLTLPTLPAATPLRVRLTRDDGGGCWEAVYSTPTRNDAGAFKDRSD